MYIAGHVRVIFSTDKSMNSLPNLEVLKPKHTLCGSNIVSLG
jgi:hypothetical protein